MCRGTGRCLIGRNKATAAEKAELEKMKAKDL